MMIMRPRSLRKNSVILKRTWWNIPGMLPSHSGMRRQAYLKCRWHLDRQRLGMDLVSLPKEHRFARCSLIDRKAWRQSGILEEHFNGGHNNHKNKVRIETIASYLSADYFVSSPIISLVTLYKQEWTCEITPSNWIIHPIGLSRMCQFSLLIQSWSQNEDCGQMSASHLPSGLGFYPVNLVSGEYVVGS